MAVPQVELKIDDADLKKLPARLADAAERGVKRVTLSIETAAVKNAPERTGNLQNSSTVQFKGAGFETVGEVRFTAKYALYVHEGTGIFGPKGKPFGPVEKKALKWTGPDGLAVFAKSVIGMPGRPFLKKAFEEEGPKLMQGLLAER